ncbi:MAG: hypothetical protein VB085_13490 [Peptococcaceae bacterium]|nr:hypothetical protein [Peptococcaceae bacterium]
MSRKIKLFEPEFRISLGDVQISQGVTFEIHQAARSWAKVRFTPAYKAALPAIALRSAAKVSLGYGDDSAGSAEVFAGMVMTAYSDGAQANEIGLMDASADLATTKITATFRQTAPAEILRHCLGQAGIRDMELAEVPAAARQGFSCCAEPIVAILERINSLWGLDVSWRIHAGKFYWGTKPAQDKIYQFVYGVSIISLTRQSGQWCLETVSVPFIRAGDLIDVDHPDFSGRPEVKKIVFACNDSGFIRSRLYF